MYHRTISRDYETSHECVIIPTILDLHEETKMTAGKIELQFPRALDGYVVCITPSLIY